MKPEELYEGIGHLDEETLARSETARRRRAPKWAAALAALVVLALIGGLLLRPNPFVLTAYALEEAQYPEMAAYPEGGSMEEHEAWWSSLQALRPPEGYADGLEDFFKKSVSAFLGETPGENQVYSPLNVYLALGMLAEVTGGESRAEVLSLLGADSLEALRTQADALWRAQYRDDGATARVLAASLWLDDRVTAQPAATQALAQVYRASSYQGEMGEQDFDRAIQTWLDQQTGGLLTDQIQSIAFEPNTLAVLAATVRFQAKWGAEFSEENTAPGPFYGPEGEETCDFMHQQENGDYYWADRFSAVGRYLSNDGGKLWFLLPDEGVAAEDLLQDPQALDFILADGQWEDQKNVRIDLALPKFDLTARLDLQPGLEKLGVATPFTPAADFTPLTGEPDLFLSQARQDVRFAIDEEGVTAAAYTELVGTGTGSPPEEVVDFTLDCPFLFALTGADGLPLFIGVVNRPG